MARTSPQPNRRPSVSGNFDLLKRALITEGNSVRFRQGKIIAYSSGTNTIDVQIGGALDSFGNPVVTQGIKLFGNFSPDIDQAVWLVTDGLDIFAVGQLAPYGGAVGATGAAGSSVLNGTGAPTLGIGAVGDFYIDTATYQIYGPRTSLSWGSPTSLVGATGATGATGPTGATGSAATIAVGTVTTGSAGSSAIIVNSGTSGSAIFDFTIPRGDTGDTGATGATGATGSAATITVGTVTTGAAGTSATVTNSGTTGAAVFDFQIPQGVSGDPTPTGSVITFAGSTSPTGWLLCDGTAVDRTTYASLFAVVGTTYGAGNGTTTFNIPNLQDRFAIGTSGTRALGTTGGASTYTLTVSNIPQHSHSIDHDHASFTSGAGSAHNHTDTLAAPAHTHTTNITHGHASTLAAPSHTHTTNIAHGHADTIATAADSHDHETNTIGDNASFLSGSGQNYRYTGTPSTLATDSDSHSHTITGGVTALGTTNAASLGPSATALTGAITDLGATATASSGASATALTGSIDNESAHTHSIDVPALTGTSGNYGTASPTAVNIIPPYLSLNYIIKV